MPPRGRNFMPVSPPRPSVASTCLLTAHPIDSSRQQKEDHHRGCPSHQRKNRRSSPRSLRFYLLINPLLHQHRAQLRQTRFRNDSLPPPLFRIFWLFIRGTQLAMSRTLAVPVFLLCPRKLPLGCLLNDMIRRVQQLQSITLNPLLALSNGDFVRLGTCE